MHVLALLALIAIVIGMIAIGYQCVATIRFSRRVAVQRAALIRRTEEDLMAKLLANSMYTGSSKMAATVHGITITEDPW